MGDFLIVGRKVVKVGFKLQVICINDYDNPVDVAATYIDLRGSDFNNIVKQLADTEYERKKWFKEISSLIQENQI